MCVNEPSWERSTPPALEKQPYTTTGRWRAKKDGGHRVMGWG